MWFLAALGACAEVVPLGLGWAAVPKADLSDCVAANDGVHDFLFCADAEDWAGAQAACDAWGYHLLDVDDAMEDAWVWAATQAVDPSANWWLGLSDAGSEGTFTWDGGSDSPYTNWRSGEPNDFGGNEDCTWYASTGGGQWNDKDCTASAYFACEAGCSTFERYEDLDGDGFGGAGVRACATEADYIDTGGDCDDADGAVHPDAAEVCDPLDVDEDCDGTSDDGDTSVDVSTYSSFYTDIDGDGFAGTNTTLACDLPAGASATVTDCDDADDTVYPGAPEPAVDATDADCDGSFADLDADGDGVDAESTGGPDCDDADGLVFPGAAERCNASDDDCNGAVDNDADCPGGVATYDDHMYFFVATPAVWEDARVGCAAAGYHLLDVADGFEEAWAWARAEAKDNTTSWWIGLNDRDVEGTFAWDGGSASAFTDWRVGEPNDYGGSEDCAAMADDGGGAWNDRDCNSAYAYVCEWGCEQTPWYADNDGDGYGGGEVTMACEAPTGTVANTTDCDDDDAAVYPGASQVTEGVDDDCDGADGNADTDDDGLQDLDEARLGTNPDDADTDNDSLPDGVEGEADTDDDGTIDPLDDDDDGDGLTTLSEVGDPAHPDDTDGDSVPDHLDLDSDDDGFSDATEGGRDTDDDGVPNNEDPDDDGDGLWSIDEGDTDLDGDGVPAYLDLDSDGDGCPDGVDCDTGGRVDDSGDADEDPEASACGCGGNAVFPGVLLLLARRRKGLTPNLRPQAFFHHPGPPGPGTTGEC